MKAVTKAWYVYMLRCNDATLYTGITTDIERRIQEHNGLKAAKYTRARQPVSLLFSKKAKTRSAALIEEARLKKLSREEKLALVERYRQKAVL
jgi:putative endonuclease